MHLVNDCYLCLDQGGHSSRALVFDQHGDLIASAQVPVDTVHLSQHRVEQDAEELVESLVESARQAIASLDDKHRQQLKSAGLATQRSSMVCWRRSTGEALSPVISWQDRRADHWLQQFHFHHEAIHKTTGLYLSAHYGVSKMRWCLDHLEAVKKAREENDLVVGPLASFLARRLTGSSNDLADPANASRTLLWNLSRSDWDQELLQLFDIPEEVLPRCAPSFSDYGELNIEGLTLPLAMVNGDQSVAIFAFGELQPDTAYINIGTGAFVSRLSGHSPIYSRRLLSSIVLDDGEQKTYVQEGTVNGAASALDWLEFKIDQKITVEKLPELLATDEEPLLFMNGVSGLAAPFWDPEFETGFIGEGSLAQQVAGVIESICFLLLENLDEMKKLSSPPLQIQVTGGLAALDALCQKLADVCQLPVYRPIDREATARGIAYLLAGSPREWPEEGIGKWFKPKMNTGIELRYRQWGESLRERLRTE